MASTASAGFLTQSSAVVFDRNKQSSRDRQKQIGGQPRLHQTDAKTPASFRAPPIAPTGVSCPGTPAAAHSRRPPIPPLRSSPFRTQPTTKCKRRQKRRFLKTKFTTAENAFGTEEKNTNNNNSRRARQLRVASSLRRERKT